MKDVYSIPPVWETIDLSDTMPSNIPTHAFAIDDTTIWIMYLTKAILVYDVNSGYKEMKKLPTSPPTHWMIPYMCMTHVDDNTIFFALATGRDNKIYPYLYDKAKDTFTSYFHLTCK